MRRDAMFHSIVSGMSQDHILISCITREGEILNTLDKAGLKAEDIDLWEINEAFAVVTLAAIDAFKLDPAKVNVNGGAVVIGHPIGGSGARVLTTLLYAMKARESRYGLATLCIGGGEAAALLVERQ